MQERGIGFIYVDRHDTSPLAIIEAVNALRRNEMLALLGERDGSSNTIRMDLFGRPSRFSGGSRLSRPGQRSAGHSGLRSVGEGELRHADGRGRSTSRADTASHAEAIQEGMQRLVAVFERYIRRYPDQWYNFFDFWGSKP